MGRLEVRFQIDAPRMLLEVHVGGTYDLRQALESFGDILATCRSQGVVKILVDFSALPGTRMARQKVLYALGVLEQMRAYELFGGRKLRIAYCGVPQAVGSHEPGLELAKAEGVDVELFSDIRRARAWLEEGDAPERPPHAHP